MGKTNKRISIISFIKKINPFVVLLFIIPSLIFVTPIPSILRYRVECLFGSSTPLLWAEGVGALQESESSPYRWYDEEVSFAEKNVGTIRISNLNKPKL